MGLHEDREEIMTAVKQAVIAAIEHHQLQCPIAQVQDRQNMVRKDLYNGEDKPGFIEEARTFFTETRSIRRWKVRVWGGVGVAVVLFGIIFGQPINDAWKSLHSLMRLADKADVIIKLSDDWQRFYDSHPAQPQPEQAPQPKKPHKSYFEEMPSGVSSKQAIPPDFAHEAVP